MPTQHWSTKLEPFRPCSEALKYARSKPSFAAAWRDCERGDWMLWILGKLSGRPDSASRKALVAAAMDTAALARQYTSGEARKAFDLCQSTVRKYLRGATTLVEVRYAAYAAEASYAYAAAAYAAEASYAYAAAAYAADAAEAAAYAAEAAAYAAAAYAADAAEAAADAADAAEAGAYAADADRTRTLSRCAAIVRRHYPNPPRLRKGA